MPKLRVVLAAEEAAGLKAFHALVQSGHEVVGVLTSPTPDARRGSTVGDAARQHGCEVIPAAQVKEPSLGRRLRKLAIDILINVHSLFIAEAEVIAAPRIGSFNLHPGPLPAYAGLNAPSWALYHGETSHAVTLHWMTPGIDTGNIAYASRFPITQSDTGLSVSARCVREGVPLISRLLADAAQEPPAIPALPQDLSCRRVYKRKDIPHGGRIDWALPARVIDAFVRAADFYPMPSPWGHPVALLDGSEVEVAKVDRTGRPCDAVPGLSVRGEAGLEVATGDEWLRVRRIRIGGRYVDPSAHPS
jgi:UDP-4-amino-4-deoxy-L-arabinose formyltransferase/UDP-glucuronic acid dehydrogenase (UDP-4-keto-hexauronic acid decarboxylating)